MKKTKAPVVPPFDEYEIRIMNFLDENDGLTIKELARLADKSSAGIVELLEGLQKKGIPIWKDKNSDTIHYGSSSIVELSPEQLVIKDNEIKIGVLSNSLMGSKYEQPTAMLEAFQIAEHKGADVMIHLGVSAGKPTAAKLEEFHKETAEEQIDYIIKNYPKSKKFKTRFISGYHDMQWRKSGINILVDVCNSRDDLEYRGDLCSTFPLRRGAGKDARWPTLKAVYHGGDTGPFSKSLPVQGYAANLINDVNALYSTDKPDIVVVGGQDTFMDLCGGLIKNIWSMPGMRLVSPSIMQKKNRSVAPTLGFAIVTVKFEKDGSFFAKAQVYPLQGRGKDYKVKYSEDENTLKILDDNEKSVIKLLDDSPKSLGEIRQAIDKSDDTVISIIDSLRGKGFTILEPDKTHGYKLEAAKKENPVIKKINFKDYFYRTVTQGAVSDTHFGSKSELKEILHEAYDLFESRKIIKVDMAGDITNGPSKHAEHNKMEVLEDRATPLAHDVMNDWPKKKEITTRMIAGDHDRWFQIQNGLDILDYICLGRKDIIYCGIQKGEIHDRSIITKLLHYNWGTAVAKSYKGQNVIEDGILKEIANDIEKYRAKVVVVLSGGGHNYCAMLYKGIIYIQLPCLQGQTGFISGLGKLSDVGFIIYSVTYSKDGVLTEFGVEYFDRGSKSLELMREKTAKRVAKKPEKIKKLTHSKKK